MADQDSIRNASDGRIAWKLGPGWGSIESVRLRRVSSGPFLREAITAFVISAAGCAPPQPEVPSVVTVTEPNKPAQDARIVVDDGKHLVEDMAAAERKYEEDHDPTDILAFFAPDAIIYAGRSEQPSASDNIMDKRSFEAVYLWASRFDSKMRFSYEDANLTRNGDSAVMQWKTSHDAGGPDQTYSFVQRYELKRRDNRWLVVKYRYWPIRPENGEEYDWEALDQQVDASRAANDQRNLARNLMLAYRFKESADVARRITEQDPNDAWNWDMRAKASAMVGDLADAEESSVRASRVRGH